MSENQISALQVELTIAIHNALIECRDLIHKANQATDIKELACFCVSIIAKIGILQDFVGLTEEVTFQSDLQTLEFKALQLKEQLEVFEAEQIAILSALGADCGVIYA